MFKRRLSYKKIYGSISSEVRPNSSCISILLHDTYVHKPLERDATTKIKIAQVGLPYWQRGVCCSSLWRMQVNKISDEK